MTRVPGPFRLLRYFSLSALLSFIAVAVLLGLLYRALALRDLEAVGERQNTVLARAIVNGLRERIEPLLQGAHPDAAAHRDHPEVAALQRAIAEQMSGLGVLKVKIYAPDGHTAFSTDAAQIGEAQDDNHGIREALAGRTTSHLVYHKRLKTYDGVAVERDVLETYIPLPGRDGAVIGVFELYGDVTALIARMETSQGRIVGGVAALLGVLYVVLFLLVRRADRVIRTQADERHRYLEEIECARAGLEQRVAERTHDLTRANSDLEAEVAQRTRAQARLRILSQAVEQSPLAVLITDARGRIEYVNPRFTADTGYAADEVIGHDPSILRSADAPEEIFRGLWTALRAGTDWRGEFPNRRKDGSSYWVFASISPVRDPDGSVSHFVAIEEDITARKRAEQDLSLAASVYESAAEGILITDTRGKILAVNPAFTALTGYAAEDVIGENASILRSDRQDRAFYDAMWEALRENGRWQGEIWNRRKNGELYQEWLTITAVRDAQGRVVNHIGVFSDITRVRESEERIRYLSYYDALTALPNRELLADRLNQAIAHAHREGKLAALLFLDLDRFKNINDTLGHAVGDQLLRTVAERVSAVVSEDDTVARAGGDEFAVVLTGLTDVDQATLVTERVLLALAKPMRLAGQEIVVGASVGISVYPNDGEDAAALIRCADSAMYAAIEQGGKSYQFFTPELNRRAHHWLSIEGRLRGALARDELRLHYQPQVDLCSGRIVGAEALLRWQPEGGEFMPPAEFIHIAEEIGLIVPIGEWALHEACRAARRWSEAGHPVRMAVNLSAVQFDQEGIEEQVRTALAATRLEPSLLELELTESILMKNAMETVETLERLHVMGVQLAIDDFGTGYSSLSYLKRFPLHALKIDQSFVRGIPGDADDVAIVQAVLALARALKLRVIAEGVGSDAQAHYLRNAGCHELQGRLFSAPLPEDEFRALLATDRRLRLPDAAA